MKGFAPQSALVLAFQAALLTLLVDQPINLVLLLVLALGLWWRAGGARWRVMLLILLLGTWSMVISQGLFYEHPARTVLVRLLPGSIFPFGTPAGLYLYREGLWHGLLQSLRLDVMVLLGITLLSRYGVDELASGLRALRLPAPLCFLVSIALRFLPMLWEEARATWQAQHFRGYRLAALPGRGGGLFQAGRALLLPLLAANVRKADEISAALISRGFFPARDGAFGVAVPARWGERICCWAGWIGLALLASVLLLTRLYLQGVALPFWMEPLFPWVVRHV